MLLTSDCEKVLFECLDVLLELGMSIGDYVLIFYITANYCISSVNEILSLVPGRSMAPPPVRELLLLIFSPLFLFTLGRPFYGVVESLLLTILLLFKLIIVF